jgi:anaerobic ribonucleoside-triphosphate reductase
MVQSIAQEACRMGKSSPMVRLSKKQVKKKIQFIRDYMAAGNAATGSVLDANANVNQKNISTLHSELNKDVNIQVGRRLLYEKIIELFDKELADEYIRQLESHEIYCHDETTIYPYCVSISMYPFLKNGTRDLGGESLAPKHFESYCGSFINMIYAISSQYAGAVATVEFLMHMDYFARKDFGPNYLETNERDINDGLQHVVYSLNQPAAARGYQCVKETTELLTPDGYKKLGDLKVGDVCYTWKDGKLFKEKIQRLNTYQFDGELMEFSGQNYKQTVTPNHRVLYKKPNCPGEYAIKEAHEVFGHSKLSLPISADNDFEDYPISDAMLELVVFVLTEGSIDRSRLQIYKSANRWGHERLKELLEITGTGYTCSEFSSEFGFVDVFRISSVDSATLMHLVHGTKKELPFFFSMLSQRQAKLVIEAWSRLDGMWQDGRPRLQCDNELIADQLQHVAFLAGYGSTLEHVEYSRIDGSGSVPGLYVKTFRRDAKRVSSYNLVPYKGTVWCPTTETGVVIFREEGTPYISGNSVFWNISIFDRPYFESIFEGFVYPGTDDRPDYDSIAKLQKYFMQWFNKERERSLLTYPVVTAAILNKEDRSGFEDPEMVDLVCKELAAGNSFFVYQSESADSLSSCCRLKNKFIEKPEFSYTLGAGGVSTGSVNVITTNISRLVQDGRDLREEIRKVHKYQVAYRSIIEDFLHAKMLPAYDAGYVTLDKQYSTIGIIGLVEAAEYLGITPGNTEEYKNFLVSILQPIYEENRKATKKYGIPFNTEMVPGESLGVKFAGWDRKAGYSVPRDCYNSYFYVVEDASTDIYDKFCLHGEDVVSYLDGGSALHLNLEEHLSEEGYKNLLKLAMRTGCNYWTTNVLSTCCEDCGYIDKKTRTQCQKCGSTNISHATRVIGYLKKISAFSEDRQKEHARRSYHASIGTV